MQGFKVNFHKVFNTFLVISLVLFVSCSSPERPKGKTEAEVLFKEAEAFVKRKRYTLAIQKLNQLKSKFPYSFYAVHAELLSADILFMQQNYVEASAAYILFRDFHPRHIKIPYVVWRIGESYYKQLPSTYDRDLTPGNEAIKYFTEVLQKYASSKYVENSKKYIDEIKGKLKEKELYIADFYFKTDVFDSARFRYLDILKNEEFANDTKLQSHAMVRVVESSLNMESYSDCVSYSDKYYENVSKSSQKQLTELKKDCSEKYNQLIKKTVE